MNHYPIPEDIIEALHIIQTVCEHSDDCINCPFGQRDTEKCAIVAEIPKEWYINNELPTVWKALG